MSVTSYETREYKKSVEFTMALPLQEPLLQQVPSGTLNAGNNSFDSVTKALPLDP